MARIKDLPKIDRPREKLEKYGPERLSDSELLAILLRTGNKGMNVIELAGKILKKFNRTGLARVSAIELKNIFGLGSAKACGIAASFEFSRRLLQNEQSSFAFSKNNHEEKMETASGGNDPKIERNQKGKGAYSISSLFAGCGGLDLGFTQENFWIKWANDNDHWACETHRRNFGNHIAEKNIADVRIKEVPKSDIILGGFPCQDFSMIWKRGGIETERGNLYRHFVRIVKGKKPLMFIGENVKGLLTANDGKAIQQIINDFGEAGYDVKAHKINFADYGAPQLRERILIIGVRKDLGKKFEMPSPIYSPKNYIPAKIALAGVEKVPFNNEHQNIAAKTREMLKLIPPGGNFSSIPKTSPYYVGGMANVN